MAEDFLPIVEGGEEKTEREREKEREPELDAIPTARDRRKEKK